MTQVWCCTMRIRKTQNSTWFSQDGWNSAVGSGAVFHFAPCSIFCGCFNTKVRAGIQTSFLKLSHCSGENQIGSDSIVVCILFKSITCSWAFFFWLWPRDWHLCMNKSNKKACYKTSWHDPADSDGRGGESEGGRDRGWERKRMALIRWLFLIPAHSARVKGLEEEKSAAAASVWSLWTWTDMFPSSGVWRMTLIRVMKWN